MIRAAQEKDTPQIMDIWLNSNIQAHNFIPAGYWLENYDAIRDTYLPMSETIVWEEAGIVKGFASLLGESYVGALFVGRKFRNCGIGASLIGYIQKQKPLLHLAVFSENIDAIRFYRHVGFKILNEQRDADTGRNELLMCWAKGNLSGDHIYNYPHRQVS